MCPPGALCFTCPGMGIGGTPPPAPGTTIAPGGMPLVRMMFLYICHGHGHDFFVRRPDTMECRWSVEVLRWLLSRRSSHQESWPRTGTSPSSLTGCDSRRCTWWNRRRRWLSQSSGAWLKSWTEIYKSVKRPVFESLESDKANNNAAYLFKFDMIRCNII